MATVEKDGDVATAITGLTIGSATYDVTFTCNVSIIDTYGLDPVFDFTDPTSAENAQNAVLAVLNDDATAAVVGCGSGDGQFDISFVIAWKLDEVTVPLPDVGNPDLDKLEVPVLLTCSGDKISSDPDLWGNLSDDNKQCILEGEVHGSAAVVASFAIAGTGGTGNSPPVADAGGPYDSSVGASIQFDGSGSTDIDGTIDGYT